MATKLINPAYELVGEVLVTSATTSVSFTGLSFTSSDDLLLVYDFYNANASSLDVFIYFNSNTTKSNYYTQRLFGINTSVSSDRNNDPRFFGITAGYKNFGVSKIRLTNSNYIVFQNETSREYGTSALGLQKTSGTSALTASSITSLTITTDGISSIGAGSRLRLYKLNATKVADITVNALTGSVSFTGLNITKDSEYMLVGDLLCTGTGSYNYITANGDGIGYSQWLGVNGTGVNGWRYNLPYISVVDVRSFFNINIKLTNNGHFLTQSNQINYYGSSNISINNWNTSSTNTFSSINSLSITYGNIDAGSRFQLYKLR